MKRLTVATALAFVFFLTTAKAGDLGAPGLMQLAEATPPTSASAIKPPPLLQAQGPANRSVMHVREQIRHMIKQLSDDQNKYDGYKEKAIQQLEAAFQNLTQAEQYAKTHPQ